MTDAWVALEPGADPDERLGLLRRAHETFTSAGRVERPVRPVVAASWRRSARARVSPDGTAPVELANDDLDAYRDSHPLARAMPLFRELMGAYAHDGEHLVAVCDAFGRMLWVEGDARSLRRAGRMNFVPGARWAESSVGTNAPGTALALDRPVQVFAAEHFLRPVHPWTCAAAPLHDPYTGRLLGAVDITGGDSLAHPHSLAFVQAVARAAESHLALSGPAPRADDDTALLYALGRDEALLVAGGSKVRLSRRHSEILVLLSRHPEGLSGDRLLCELYEDESVTPVTLRAELSRLRRLLGPDLLCSRPYRLTVPVEADFTVVARRLGSGAVAAAMGAYAGPLLPGSQAPAVVRLRGRLEGELRAALVARADPGLLSDWVHSPWGEDDVAVWQALAEVTSVRQHPSVHARVRALEAELRAPAPVHGTPSPAPVRANPSPAPASATPPATVLQRPPA
ncbi:transcriptional regulator [Streptomyces spiroverticillatus]|uniref:Transcriptional regulator n=1 Tax=Streptomyces finlayi TaxID=67296 RepID=A0A918X3N9_9ACTN|nr:helix-turn-helix domain-containing protein [Streptomyces finlayi]GHA27582.1 transcriptional regulator [Streptomyces spiroverticillatus]GHD08680.1 transcriptional regulator [Streptomyces finlayi]